jgi:hypothetical protein
LHPNRPGAAQSAPLAGWLEAGEKKSPPPALLPQMTPETATSPRESAPAFSALVTPEASLSHNINPQDGAQDIKA